MRPTRSRFWVAVLVGWAAAVALVGSVGGQPISFDGCVDSRGFAVASQANEEIADVAQARLAPNGAPVIFYNRRVLSWFSPETRLWWYGHECAHHALGHLRAGTFPPAAERQADCWAASELVRKELLSKEDLRVVAADLARLGRGDWSHLPGAFRAIDVLSCGDGADTPEDDEKDSEGTECRVRFRSWQDVTGGSASFDLEIEGEEVALLDNDLDDDEETIECPEPGTREYRLRNIEIRAPNGRVAGRGRTCTGRFRATRSKTTYAVILEVFPGQLRCRID